MDRSVKAAVLNGANESLKVKEYPMPTIEPGAALVAVEMAGVCGTDVHLQHGKLKIPYPVILGHETVGRLVRLGEGLQTDLLGKPLHEGDRIQYTSSIPCGRCYYCAIAMEPTRCLKRKVYGVTLSCANPPHLFGGQAEMVYLLPGAYIFKLTDELPNEAVTAFGCAAPTVVHAAERAGGVMPGDNVVIQGAGPVGLFSLILALESGAHRTVVLDAIPSRLSVALSFGATQTIDISKLAQAERVQSVIDATDDLGADVVFECTGAPEAFAEGILMCRDAGKYVEVGQYTDRGETAVNPHHITRKQIVISGSWAMLPRHYYRALRIIQQNWRKYGLDKLVTHRFNLDPADEALRVVERGEAVKSVVVPKSFS
ncbi:MAG: zinc-binding dehydrogenase [Candidatus Bathyarchaeia archaeon]